MWCVTLAGSCCHLPPHCSSSVCDSLQCPSHFLSACVHHPRRRQKLPTTARKDDVVDYRDDEADDDDDVAAADDDDEDGRS